MPIFVLYIVFNTVTKVTRNSFINRWVIVVSTNNRKVKVKKNIKVVKIR